MMTHRELCLKAAKYLRYRGIQPFHRCAYVVCEFERIGECPDAFGWGGWTTQLIEVKASRSDYLSDKKKQWRKDPKLGLGKYRSYLCQEGIIKPEDLPDKWGLLYTDGSKIIRVVEPVQQYSNHMEELQLVTSILRREGVKYGVYSYKKYSKN